MVNSNSVNFTILGKQMENKLSNLGDLLIVN
jgi:hypothetical protein